MILCRIFGHKWKFMGCSGSEYFPSYAIYKCQRCGRHCRVSEKDGKEEIYA